MESKKLSDKKNWMRDFLDREEELHVGKLGEMLYTPGNEQLRGEFEGLRRLTDLSVDEEKLWRNIQVRMDRGMRSVVWRCLKYVAMIVLPLCVGVVGWILFPQEKVEQLAVTEVLAPGKSSAYLLLSGGKRVDLSAMTRDTMLVEWGANVRVDTTGRVSYVSTGGEEIKEIVYNTIVVPRAGEYKLELADGTRVWLNSESELRYPVEFPDDYREVYLKGEGYFEVARDTGKPFRVQVGEERGVRVLGTDFNVTAYPNEKEVVVTLLAGQVDMFYRARVEMLQPDEQVILDVEEGDFRKWKVDAATFVAWKNGVFLFEGCSLERIMKRLERWYGIEVIYTDEQAKNICFDGEFRKYDDCNVVLKLLEHVANIKVDIENKRVIIGSK